MKKSLFLYLILTSHLFSQESRTISENFKIYSLKENLISKIPSEIIFDKERGMKLSDFDFWLKNQFNKSIKEKISYHIYSEEKDNIGYIHYRIQQTIDEIPVENGYYVLHTKDGIIKRMNGLIYSEIEFNASPKNQLNDFDFTEKALSYFEKKGCEAKISSDIENCYIPNFVDDEAKLILVKKMIVSTKNPFGKYALYISPDTGEMIKKTSLLQSIHILGTGNTVYSGKQTIACDSSETGEITLKDVSRGNGIETYNLNNGSSTNSRTPFVNSSSNWNNIENSKNQYALDAHFGTACTFDYFLEKHQRNSIDNKGFKLINNIHFGVDFANAYWDGSQMIYGDGNGTIKPLVTLDVIGHEITHGLTANTAKLVLENESGALNESFSDIFGSTIDWSKRPNKANWTIGEDASPFIRSLENPAVNNDPKAYKGINWKPDGGADFGGIHSNNGVQNHWYYLLVNGGNSQNEFGFSYTIKGIGLEKAAQITYRNLTIYLTSLSNYTDARYYSIISASDLFGACSPEVEAVTNAWYAVGIGELYSPGVKANFKVSCKNGVGQLGVFFTNNSSNATKFEWNFGDNLTSTEIAPYHTYSTPGNYSVKLLAIGEQKCGFSDSIIETSLIQVSPYLPSVDETIEHCNGRTLTLKSNIGSTKWYSKNDLSSLIKKDTTFELKDLSVDTVLYSKDGYFSVGEANTNNTTNHNPGSTVSFFRYTVFDVNYTLILKSVKVIAFSDGIRRIQLRDSKGTIIRSSDVFIKQGVQTIDINFTIYPGIDYRIGVEGPIVSLGRSYNNLKYPYTIKDLITIKRSNAIGQTDQSKLYYYYFYEWEIEKITPTNELTKTIINSNASVPKISSISFNKNTQKGTFTILNYSKKKTYTFTPSVNVIQTDSFVSAPIGTYTITSRLGDCTNTSDKIEISGTLDVLNAEDFLFAVPNPCSETITFQSNQNNKSIYLQTIDGKILLENIALNEVINTSNLTPGIYIVIYKNREGKLIYKRIIKE